MRVSIWLTIKKPNKGLKCKSISLFRGRIPADSRGFFGGRTAGLAILKPLIYFAQPCSRPYGESARWMGGRAVEGARLESVYTSKAYRGFESHPIRHFTTELRTPEVPSP